MTFIEKDGTEVKLAVSEGDNLLDIAQANDLEMEGELLAPLPQPTYSSCAPSAVTANNQNHPRRLWRIVRLLDLPCNRHG